MGALLFLAPVLVALATEPASATTTPGVTVSAESSPYGEVLMVGSGQFAGYSLYQFDRNTVGACTTTVVTVGNMPLSCAGAQTDKTADWPVLTTVGKPVAGPGINRHLLGTVFRKDIAADQVTYGGKLLYLFDTMPHVFQGENDLETVLPLPPNHGVWSLVSAKDGSPAVGSVAVTTQTVPKGPTVLAADMLQGFGGATPIIVYTYSKDTKNHSVCTGQCALVWMPVLTTAAPQATGLPLSSLGEIRRADGAKQLTFDGKPLYLYSGEVAQLNPANGMPLNPATIGTGNGMNGPAHFGGRFSIVPAPTA
jgi:predicted lipoprotein with Yx(FWY)xxD motif